MKNEIALIIADAKHHDRLGKTGRSGVILIKAAHTLHSKGQHDDVKTIISELTPSEWHPNTVLGLLGCMLSIMSFYELEYEKLLADLKIHLATLPDWDEERIDTATRGL